MNEHQVGLMAFDVARELVKSGAVEGDVDRLADVIARAIIADLKVEDDLDAEVLELLKGYASFMRANNVDHQTMFARVKKKLVQERKLVL